VGHIDRLCAEDESKRKGREDARIDSHDGSGAIDTKVFEKSD
jgi:hypothetical protein